jgi:hypothetical protein
MVDEYEPAPSVDITALEAAIREATPIPSVSPTAVTPPPIDAPQSHKDRLRASIDAHLPMDGSDDNALSSRVRRALKAIIDAM